MREASVTAFLAIFLIVQAHSIRFYLEPNSHKCLKEEVHANVLVTGEYEVTEAIGQKTDYVVSKILEIVRVTFFSSFAGIL